MLKFSGHGAPPEPTSPVVPFATIIDAWALEHPNPKNYHTGKCRKLSDFLGYDDAARVTPEEIVRFKKHLLTSGFAPKSVQNVFAGVKTIFKFGVANKEITADLTVGITYKARRDPKRKRQPFTFDEARLILGAARNAGPELFFPNLIGAFSGTRLAEVVEAHTDDVEMIDGLWCLNLREDNREQNQTLKNEPSVRKLPLHEEIIKQGFVTYKNSLPKGPLFPQYRKNKYNRRNDSASKENSNFIRGLGITDRRKGPMHSWRHYFKTVARGLIEEQISDTISGHGSKSEGRQYGIYELRLMAADSRRIKNSSSAEWEGFSANVPKTQVLCGFPDPLSQSCVSHLCIPRNQENATVLQPTRGVRVVQRSTPSCWVRPDPHRVRWPGGSVGCWCRVQQPRRPGLIRS